jgi:hypothetical protein
MAEVETYQTIHKNTAVVLEARPYDDHWLLYCKKNNPPIKCKIDTCIRVGRLYGGFVSQRPSPESEMEIVPLSKVQHYEIKANGDIRIVLSVCDKTERKRWAWYHFLGKTEHPAEKWGKLCAAQVDFE